MGLPSSGLARVGVREKTLVGLNAMLGTLPGLLSFRFLGVFEAWVGHTG